jgi:hypothetical protein
MSNKSYFYAPYIPIITCDKFKETHMKHLQLKAQFLGAPWYCWLVRVVVQTHKGREFAGDTHGSNFATSGNSTFIASNKVLLVSQEYPGIDDRGDLPIVYLRGSRTDKDLDVIVVRGSERMKQLVEAVKEYNKKFSDAYFSDEPASAKIVSIE